MIETAKGPDVHGHTVFCEDIRQEVGGKVSFMGVYQGALQVHTRFPAAIPRFVFAISYLQRKSVFQPKVALRIYLPGDEDEKPSIESNVDGPAVPDVADLPGVDDQFILMRADVALAGLTIKEPGVIKVRAFRDGTLYPLGSLAVLQGDIVEQPNQTPDA